MIVAQLLAALLLARPAAASPADGATYKKKSWDDRRPAVEEATAASAAEEIVGDDLTAPLGAAIERAARGGIDRIDAPEVPPGIEMDGLDRARRESPSSPGEEASRLLFGRWGDPHVVHLDGRVIALRAIEEPAGEGVMIGKVQVYDVSDAGDDPKKAYGRAFDPTEGGPWEFRLGGEGSKRYKLELVKTYQGDFVKLTRPDGTEAANAEGTPILLSDLESSRKAKAAKAWENPASRRVVDGVEYALVPYFAGGKVCTQLFDARKSFEVAGVECRHTRPWW